MCLDSSFHRKLFVNFLFVQMIKITQQSNNSFVKSILILQHRWLYCNLMFYKNISKCHVFSFTYIATNVTANWIENKKSQQKRRIKTCCSKYALLWISVSNRCLEIKWYSTLLLSWFLLARLVSGREQKRKGAYLKPRLSESLLRLKASELSPLLTLLQAWNTVR